MTAKTRVRTTIWIFKKPVNFMLAGICSNFYSYAELIFHSIYKSQVSVLIDIWSKLMESNIKQYLLFVGVKHIFCTYSYYMHACNHQITMFNVSCHLLHIPNGPEQNDLCTFPVSNTHKFSVMLSVTTFQFSFHSILLSFVLNLVQ